MSVNIERGINQECEKCKELQKKLAKMTSNCTKLTKELLAKGEKVIIWSSFVTNMLIFENHLYYVENG